MTRYFKFKTIDDLVAEAARMGSDLPCSADFSALFQPATVGPLTVGNRFCIQPMEGCDGTLDGAPDELTFRRFRRFGAGGAKLIWGEATAIDLSARMNPRQLCLTEANASSIGQLLQECRDAHREAWGTTDGLVVGLQLTHSGRYSFQQPQIAMHDPLLDSLTTDKSTGRVIDDSFAILSDSDLQRIEDQYVGAAHLAANIGCDFIDLKQCHRYLLSELLGARLRPGQYGGSLSNRTRLIRNVVQRLRAELPNLVLATRFNAYDGLPFRRTEGGEGVPIEHHYPLQSLFGVKPDNFAQMDLTEPLQLATWLVEWGVSLLNVSAGNPYANPHVLRPAEYPPVDGYQPPEHPLLGVLRHFAATSAIQRAVPDTPVVGSAYSWLQEFSIHAAAGNVMAGNCTFAGLGRATLSQPHFVQQLIQHGRLDRKQTCRTFSYCTNLMRSKDHPLGQTPTGCPPFDKEVYGKILKDLDSKSSATDQNSAL